MPAPYLSLLLADGRLPSGAHTQSAGLEPALHAGMQPADVPAYVSVRLRTVTALDAATAVLARHHWLAFDDRCRGAVLVDVDEAWRARTLSDALRDASDLLGRSYLRMAAAVWQVQPLVRSGRIWCRPVVVGAVAAAAGLSAEETARVMGYDDVQAVISAALKLRPFDPALGVRWLAAAEAEVEAMVGKVSRVTAPAELPASSAPQIESWAQRHKDSERRLFRA